MGPFDGSNSEKHEMPGFSLSPSRPIARALVVGNETCRAAAADILTRLGHQISNAPDPYTAFAELCRRPMAYRSIILSLGGLYREELAVISTIRRRLPNVEIYLTQTDGRAAALAEAMRLGAAGLLSEEGFHPLAQRAEAAPPRPAPSAAEPACPEHTPAEPILTPDELRALLEEPAQGHR